MVRCLEQGAIAILRGLNGVCAKKIKVVFSASAAGHGLCVTGHSGVRRHV